jgi:dienelactone hydrolase
MQGEYSMKKVTLVIFGLFALLLLSLSTQLSPPRPTGPYQVGRRLLRWVDTSRPEGLTASLEDHREVVAVIWYPAQVGTGSLGTYFPDLTQLAPSLRRSGEISPVEVFGLRLIHSNSYQTAAVSPDLAAYPVVILSPGNGTNVEFYSALAEDLASHGYVVAGLNHPYDVAAVLLADGSPAQFAAQAWPLDIKSRQTFVQERIDVRVQDAIYLPERLQELNLSPGDLFYGQLDLNAIAIMGHSLGGITAAQACRVDGRFKACLNLDGLQAGGAFSARAIPPLPLQPFMMITKEVQFPPAFISQFDSLVSESYLVQVRGASHDSFTDGPALVPALLPLEGKADRIMADVRAYTLAFFDQVLKGQTSESWARSTQDGRVSVKIFPGR